MLPNSLSMAEIKMFDYKPSKQQPLVKATVPEKSPIKVPAAVKRTQRIPKK